MILTAHARARAREMHVSVDQIAEAVAHPHFVLPGGCRYPGTRNYIRDQLTVVIGQDDKVVTLLWHLKEGRY